MKTTFSTETPLSDAMTIYSGILPRNHDGRWDHQCGEITERGEEQKLVEGWKWEDVIVVPRSDCREIERRLNECVKALENAEPVLWIFAYSGRDTKCRHKQLLEAIANARKPL